MKEYYRIKEISTLYDIGPDSLRYYEEIGILHPMRGENGYRLYTMADIYRLNVIKDLRQLGFSMQRIKAYLDGKNIASTLSLLREETELIEREVARLEETHKNLSARIAEFESYAHVQTGKIDLLHYEARPCVHLSTDVVRDEEIDFALNKLHKRFEHKIHRLDNYLVGATQSVSDVRSGLYGRFHSVFFILEREETACDFMIPEGHYLSLHYRGGYGQSTERIREVLSHADAAGYRTQGDILEIYKIDVHETNAREEFLTEVQLMVERGSGTRGR